MRVSLLFLICLFQDVPSAEEGLPLIGPAHDSASAARARVLVHHPDRKWQNIRESVGIKVKVEGLAWGFHEKGYGGPHLILEGATVGMSGLEARHCGRLLRVTGTIRSHVIKAAPLGSQGLGSDALSIFIEPDSIEVIPRVRTPAMEQID